VDRDCGLNLPYCGGAVQIPAELITLNPDYLGNVDRAPKEVIEDERRKAWEVCRTALPDTAQ
jgi:hypothetical protein